MNQLCSELCDLMHICCERTAKVCRKPSNYKGNRPRKLWWNNDCSIAKSRVKFWYDIWVSCNRPRSGHVFSSYKLAKKHFRKLCKDSINAKSRKAVNLIDQMYFSKKSGKMWNLVRRAKDINVNTSDAINIKCLQQFYTDKLCDVGLRNNTVCEANSQVQSKYSEISDVTMNFYLYEERLRRYIKNTKSGCAHGIDGILSEHLKYAADNDIVINQLCVMFSLFLKYGVVPDIFLRGIVIPLLKQEASRPDSSAT